MLSCEVWETVNNTYFEDIAQKMKFSIKDFFSKRDQSAWNCGFGHIYLRSP